MELVILPDDWKEILLARMETWEGTESTVRQERVTALQTELVALKNKLDGVNSASADGSLELDEFRELKNSLIPRKIELEQQIAVLAGTKTSWLELMRE